MIIDQPDASSSTNSPSPPHLATFVVDPNLPRERYVKLIEAEGVIHKLVQRLMEKHGGENNVSKAIIPFISRINNAPSKQQLRLALLITSTGSHTRTSFRQDFTRPTSFLVSLPKLAMRFVLGRSASRPGKAWPAFSDITNVADESRVKGINVRRRKHEVEAEQGLLDGVVGGLEVSLNRSVSCRSD